jgi:uncharacterized membrane protein
MNFEKLSGVLLRNLGSRAAFFSWRRKMTWNQWYAIRSYIRSSLWIVPFVALLLEQLALHIAVALDARFDWIPSWPLSEAGTTAALQTIISLNLSFIVFTFGSMLVAIQVASGQLTPRIIATTLLRDNVIRNTVGLFVFTMLFAIGAVVRVGFAAPRLVIWLSSILGLISIAAFLFLIDYTARLLRPVSIVWRVGEQGMAVIKSVYPNPIEDTDSAPPPLPQLGKTDRIISHRGTSAIILAVNIQAFIAEAQRTDSVIEFVPRVGDFIAVEDPLLLLHGGTGTADERTLLGAVAFGPERTIEQDSTFAFRVIVDIAIKALSKAINDPTTAVLAIDQLHRLLRTVGKRHLQDEQILDSAGQLRLVFPTPNWEDFVQIACSEIRLYGAENFQVARRLRAMINNLTEALPEWRRPALCRELELLDRSIEYLYIFPEDRALARTPDKQGLGGSTGHRKAEQ